MGLPGWARFLYLVAAEVVADIHDEGLPASAVALAYIQALMGAEILDLRKEGGEGQLSWVWGPTCADFPSPCTNPGAHTVVKNL